MQNRFELIDTFLPIDPFTFKGIIACVFIPFVFILFRYFLVSSAVYYISWKKDYFKFPKVHQKNIKDNQFRVEISYSVISSLIFAISSLVMAWLWWSGSSLIYLSFNYGFFGYHLLSFIALCFLHEVYFYGTHILMHKPLFYKSVHAIHHYSHETSPFTSFSFHPWEAIVHAAFLPMAILIIPLHPLTIIIYLMFMTLTAVSNHSGVEIIKWKWLRDEFISGEFHGQHHLKFNVNFGLYFTMIDRLFGTADSIAQGEKSE